MIRSIRLAARDLASFFRARTFIFLLLVLGLTAAMYSSLDAATAWLDQAEYSRARTQFDQRVCLGFSEEKPAASAFARLLEDAEAWGACSVAFYPIPGGLADGSRQPTDIVALSRAPEELVNAQYGFREGGFLTQQEIDAAEPRCVVTANALDYDGRVSWLGETMEIGGLMLTVRGVADSEMFTVFSEYLDMRQIVVPAGCMRGSTLGAEYVELTWDAPPPEEQLAAIRAWLEAEAPNAEAVWPVAYAQTANWSAAAEVLARKLLWTALAVGSMLSILLGWLTLNRPAWYALYICGASRRTLLFQVALEVALLCLPAAILAWLGYLGSDELMGWAFVSVRLSPAQGALVCLFVTALVAAVAVPRARGTIWRLAARGGE